MHSPSEEQQHIIDCMRRGDNCIVDACAGSGKSTTVLACALQMPHKRALQITYNAQLRHDVKHVVERENIANLQVHTYHSISVNFFGRKHRDKDIRDILRQRASPKSRHLLLDFDLVFIDECQDMTPMYFQFVRYLLELVGKPVQIMILGDKKQGLYDFKDADTRFLTMAEQVWKPDVDAGRFFCSSVFHKCTLRTSYRITWAMAEFVNQIMLGEERLLACRGAAAAAARSGAGADRGGGGDERVVYISREWRYLEKFVVAQIIHLVVDLGVPFDHIFILALSVTGARSNVRRMENALVQQNFPLYVPLNEAAEKLDERVTKGKIVASSFHSVKGRERPYVFVVNFDNSYFYNTGLELRALKECPNPLYVACTRASKKLFLLECENSHPLEFLKKVPTEMLRECGAFLDYKGLPRGLVGDSGRQQQQQQGESQRRAATRTTPSQLIKFLPEDLVETLTEYMDRFFIKREKKDRHHHEEEEDDDDDDDDDDDEEEDKESREDEEESREIQETREEEDEEESCEEDEEESCEEADEEESCEDEEEESCEDEEESCEEEEGESCEEVDEEESCEEADEEGEDEEEGESGHDDDEEEGCGSPERPLLDIPTVIQTQQGFFEDVSDINGVAIPNLCFGRIFPEFDGEDALYRLTRDVLEELGKDRGEHAFLKAKFQELSSRRSSSLLADANSAGGDPERRAGNNKIADSLYLANLYLSIQERLYYRLKQISYDEHKWLSPEMVDLCTERIRLLLLDDDDDDDARSTTTTTTTSFPLVEQTILVHEDEEVHVRYLDEKVARFFASSPSSSSSSSSSPPPPPPPPKLRFAGRVDLLYGERLFEIKCTTETQFEHFLQTAIYAWLWNSIGGSHPTPSSSPSPPSSSSIKASLVNVRTDERWDLAVGIEELDEMMGVLLRGKYAKSRPLDDAEFLSRVR